MPDHLDASDMPTLRKLIALADVRAENINKGSWKMMNSDAYKRSAAMLSAAYRTGRDVRNRTFIDGARHAADWLRELANADTSEASQVPGMNP